MTKNLCILGSTGSIGTQSLDVVRQHGMKVTALTANGSVDKMEDQIREFHPKKAAMLNDIAARDLKTRVADTDTEVLSGVEGICECATDPACDTVLNSIVGIAGLLPTLDAIGAGMTIALANKETLVTGGQLVTQAARKNHVTIYPVDSEHSAIFQSLQAAPPERRLKKIILTASGGPFFGKTRDELEGVTVKEALNHPNWSMGAKITIDSATMMNKGLEIIEARWLFGTPGEKIDVVVHPESIIHSMVEYADGSVIAQMGHPDMREAIQFAFSFPHRLTLNNRKLNFAELGSLSFFVPDMEKFPALGLAYESLRKGGNMACIMNAANEAAVAAFLQEKIGFYEITDVVQECMAGADFVANPDLDTIFETNDAAFAHAKEIIARVSSAKTF